MLDVALISVPVIGFLFPLTVTEEEALLPPTGESGSDWINSFIESSYLENRLLGIEPV
jgi:hypothetical protein